MGLVRHLAKRGVLLIITIVFAIYLTVLIANGGGYIDDLLKAQIGFDLRTQLNNDRAYRLLPPAEQARIYNETYAARVEARGLNRPFLERTFRYTIDALRSWEFGSGFGWPAKPSPSSIAAQRSLR